MVRRRPPRRGALRLVLALLLGAILAAPLEAGEALARLEEAFRVAARRANEATVLVTPRGVLPPRAGLSSGVIVSPAGLVLTDADAGLMWRSAGAETEKVRLDDVEVRLSVASGPPRTFAGRVVARDRGVDAALVRILGAGASDLPWVGLGDSDELEPGAFLIAAGIAFDESGAAPPTVTAGILASADPLPPGRGGGRWAQLYTTAAVNQGVNGGPVVGLDGRLVGTVSTWVEPGPDAPQPLLGKVVPLERIRAVVLAAGERLPAPTRPSELPPAGARALEEVVGAAARRAREAVVSLIVERRRPISSRVPTTPQGEALPRWTGAVSGVLLDADGWIATSLYNLTNVGSLVFPLWRAPQEDSVEAGLADVLSVEAWLPGGARAPARLVGHDPRIGMVLLKIEPAALAQTAARALESATDLVPGRFVITLGDPFGPERRPLPLVTLGILSKQHAAGASAPWRGAWQSDAPAIDTNAGGVVADLDGHLVGMLQLWHPARHGRNSGVAFVVPSERLRAAALDIRTGRVPPPAFLGVRFGERDPPRIEDVVPDGPAARAGLEAGDRIVRLDSEEVATVEDAVNAVGFRYEGEVLEVTLERAGTLRTLTVRLGRRTP